VLIIWGKQDYTVPFAESEWWMILMPTARLVPIESAGHLPQWEQPEAVHSELLAFLTMAGA
jgi:pimeloyl-ACP methyl ester carboxylesterase